MSFPARYPTADSLPRAAEQAALLKGRLRELQSLVAYLPEYLQESIHSFPYEVRSEYRRRIALALPVGQGAYLARAAVPDAA